MRILLIVFICLLGIQAQAQYGGGRYNRGMSSQPRTQMPAPEPKTPSEIVEEHINDYQEVFDLDNFEKEVLKNALIDHITKLQDLQGDRTLKAEDIREKYDRLQNEFKQSLSSLMNPDEINKLIAMDFSKKAERKRRKSKDN